jgi:hypothetical protein
MVKNSKNPKKNKTDIAIHKKHDLGQEYCGIQPTDIDPIHRLYQIGVHREVC